MLEHPDRLTRGGSGSIMTRLALHGRRVDAMEPDEPAEGLVEECVAVLTKRAARLAGRRASKRRAERMRACGERVLHRESEDA
jgi:putative resolvase